MTLINTPQALDLLTHVVNTKGEGYRVSDCVYFASDLLAEEVEDDTIDLTGHVKLTQPCCIVGHVLHLIDFEFSLADNFDTAITSVHGIDEVFTAEAQEALAAAQKEQDSGRPWGEALDAARHDAMRKGLV